MSRKENTSSERLRKSPLSSNNSKNNSSDLPEPEKNPKKMQKIDEVLVTSQEFKALNETIEKVEAEYRNKHPTDEDPDATQPDQHIGEDLVPPKGDSPSPSQDGLTILSKEYEGASLQSQEIENYRRNKDFLQPLGKLSKEELYLGLDVLQEIQKLIEKKVEKHEERYTELSNEFYTVIPTQNDRSPLPVINTEHLLKEKLKILKALGLNEIEV
jgi:hypothetical protein